MKDQIVTSCCGRDYTLEQFKQAKLPFQVSDFPDDEEPTLFECRQCPVCKSHNLAVNFDKDGNVWVDEDE